MIEVSAAETRCRSSRPSFAIRRILVSGSSYSASSADSTTASTVSPICLSHPTEGL